MRIERLVYSNIDTLYESFVEAKKNIKNNASGMDNVNKMMTMLDAYKDVNITLFIEDCSVLESFILSTMGDGAITKMDIDNPFNEEKYPELRKNTESILRAIISLDKDPGLSTNPSTALLPIGCHRRNMTMIFRGNDVMNILGSDVTQLFNQLFADTATEKIQGGTGEAEFPNKFPSASEDKDFTNKLINIMIYMFRNKFYETFNKLIIMGNEWYDSYLNRNYLKYLSSSKHIDITPAVLLTPCGSLNFLGKTHNPKNQIANIKEVSKDSNFNPAIGATMVFAVKSSLLTFFNLTTEYGDIKYAIESMNIPLTNPVIEAPAYMKKYDARVMTPVGANNIQKIKTINDKNDVYFAYEMICGMERVRYLLYIPLNSSWEVNDEESNTMINQELKTIFEKINSTIQSVNELIK